MSARTSLRSRFLHVGRNRDERGAVLVLAAAGIVVALIAASLAVDLGTLAQEARQDQKVADLAALDAIRDVPANYQTAARASATRNLFPNPSVGVTAVEGTKSGNNCVSSPGAGSACVTVTSTHKNDFPFVGSGNTVTRSAVASNVAFGGFMIGSSLVTLDTSRSGLLNSFLGGMLKGSALSVSLVSWQGLAAGNVTLSALQTQLATMGFSVGTVSQLLSANLTVSQLVQATAAVLNAQGGSSIAIASTLATIQAAITNSTQVTLGSLIHVSQGADNMALGSQFNVLQLLTGSAELANGSNFINVPNVGINVLNTLSTAVKLQVIQPPQYYFGPVGGSVSTAQIDLTITTKLNLPVTVLGLAGVTVTNDLPIHITGAGAVGTLKAASCAGSAGITVTVDPSAFSGSASTTLHAVVSTLVGPIATIDFPETNVVPSTNGSPVDLGFNYPSEFPPPLGTETSKHAGSQPIGLSGLTTVSSPASPPATVTPIPVLGLTVPIPVPVGTIVAGVLGALSPVLANVDTLVVTPVLQALGVDVGSADVTAESLQCATPALAG